MRLHRYKSYDELFYAATRINAAPEDWDAVEIELHMRQTEAQVDAAKAAKDTAEYTRQTMIGMMWTFGVSMVGLVIAWFTLLVKG